MHRTILALMLTAAAGMTACGSGAQEPAALAVVNGKTITENEFEFRWSELSPAIQAHYQENGGKRKFLDELISNELLLQEAHRRGLDQTPAFRERLQRARERLALEELMRDAVKAKVQVTEDEVKSYYTAHADAIPDEDFHAAHILVASQAEAKYLRKLLEGGAEFGKLAQKFSIDPATRHKNGDLGLYQKGAFGPDFDEALRALRPGMVSEPVKSDAGFHLVRLLSRAPGDPERVQAARERLRRELYAEKQQERFEQFMSQLRTGATIRVADTSALAVDGAEPDRSPSP